MTVEHPALEAWPVAVRSAERLRGTLVRCGPGLRPASRPEAPSVRLAALEPWPDSAHVAVHLTAAWVWGAAREPGETLQLSTADGRRAGDHAGPGVSVHEFRCDPAEIVRLGRRSVTSPLRTAYDLLRLGPRFDAAERIACRLLMNACPDARERIRTRLDATRDPRRRLAIGRLRSL